MFVFNYTCDLLVCFTAFNQSEQVVTVAGFNNNGTCYLFINIKVSVITFYSKVSVTQPRINEANANDAL
ncbi:protein of unknown function [Moritella yayanosii]|uniref:Uncharacterized protein n=1 Tax=Moritella yayanosii TaxID=69539 RepID=A0A330LNY8_9GAMM|nr:protein of unknown function [Moritella yayanosii]